MQKLHTKYKSGNLSRFHDIGQFSFHLYWVMKFVESFSVDLTSSLSMYICVLRVPYLDAKEEKRTFQRFNSMTGETSTKRLNSVCVYNSVNMYRGFVPILFEVFYG